MPEAGEKNYRIGEVAEILHLKTSVLRFWEEKFPQIEPLYTEKGQRLYTDDHIALFRRIRNLLHEQGMTIKGARRVLENRTAGEEENPVKAEEIASAEFLEMLMEDLLDIKELLSGDLEK